MNELRKLLRAAHIRDEQVIGALERDESFRADVCRKLGRTHTASSKTFREAWDRMKGKPE